MTDGSLPTPLAPDDREQAKLRREAEDRLQRTEELAAKILAERGPEFKYQAEHFHGQDDPEKRELIARVAAYNLAQRLNTPVSIHPVDERVIVPEAIKQVETAEKLALQQAQEAEKTARAAEATQKLLVQEKQAQEAEEREAQQAAARDAARKEPTPGSIERFDAALEASKARAQETQQPKAEHTPAQLLANAKTLGQTNETAAAAWATQANSLERQQHQHGRYDVLKSGGAAPPASGTPSIPPRDPIKPAPTPPSSGPLAANDVLQRFGNPELMARYHQDTQQRQQEAKSAVNSVDSATRTSARGNAPIENSLNSSPLASIVSAATKKKIEEEKASRTNEAGKTLGRGGRDR